MVVARTDVQAGAVPRECAVLNVLAHLPFSFGAPPTKAPNSGPPRLHSIRCRCHREA